MNDGGIGEKNGNKQGAGEGLGKDVEEQMRSSLGRGSAGTASVLSNSPAGSHQQEMHTRPGASGLYRGCCCLLPCATGRRGPPEVAVLALPS